MIIDVTPIKLKVNIIVFFNIIFVSFVYWLRPLEVPDSTGSWSPIQPGLYKGQYSAHGIEIVCIKYNEDMSHIIGTKVTVSIYNFWWKVRLTLLDFSVLVSFIIIYSLNSFRPESTIPGSIDKSWIGRTWPICYTYGTTDSVT